MTDDRPRVNIVRQRDGSWTAHPQPPLPAVSTFVTEGWPQVAALRDQFGAVEHFSTDGYAAFVQEFGPPPA